MVQRLHDVFIRFTVDFCISRLAFFFFFLQTFLTFSFHFHSCQVFWTNFMYFGLSRLGSEMSRDSVIGDYTECLKNGVHRVMGIRNAR